MRRTLLLAVAIGALVFAPSIARAVPIPIGGSNGLNNLGTFSGTFDYIATDDTSGTVNIFLSNDSLTAGWITAFVFNIPTGANVTGSVLTSNDNANFLPGLFNPDNVSGQPFGLFDIGAASGGGSFEGGGAPNLGIAQNGSATFSFALTGTGLGALTAQDFLSTLSLPPAGEGVQDFVVRFRGFADSGSDKVPNEGGGSPVPEPGTMMLVGLGAASLVARRRLRP